MLFCILPQKNAIMINYRTRQARKTKDLYKGRTGKYIDFWPLLHPCFCQVNLWKSSQMRHEVSFMLIKEAICFKNLIKDKLNIKSLNSSVSLFYWLFFIILPYSHASLHHTLLFTPLNCHQKMENYNLSCSFNSRSSL